MMTPGTDSFPIRSSFSDEDTAGRILVAAERLFAERGFDGVSVRDIATAAGCNKALVFYYFDSKDGVLDRILDSYYRQHAAALATTFEATGSLEQRWHAVLDAYLDFLEEHPRFPSLVQRELSQGRSRGAIQRGTAELAGWFATAFAEARSGRRALDSRHFFVSFLGMSTAYFVHAPILGPLWGIEPLGVAARRERREHLHWMVDTILAGLDAEAARANERGE